MTLINAWWASGGADREDARRVFLHCDGCLPPEFVFGPLSRVAAAGWRFDDLEQGPHRCSWCAGRRPGLGARRASKPERDPALPNLLVIGAAKCGTTSLHRYLGLHPEIHMSATKELRFFQDPACLEKLDTYATFFDRAAPVRGESSPRYTFDPLVPGVPERIGAAIPHAKLIYLVRDPLERTVSQYVDWHSQRWRGEADSLEEALGDLEDPYNEYIAAGRYATQLERFRSVFSADQLLVVDQAELMGSRVSTMRAIFRFLDVDEDFVSSEFEDEWNVGGEKRAAARSSRSIAALRAVRRRLPRRAWRFARAPIGRPAAAETAPPTVDADLRARLSTVFHDEVERLRALTGEELAGWMAEPAGRSREGSASG